LRMAILSKAAQSIRSVDRFFLALDFFTVIFACGRDRVGDLDEHQSGAARLKAEHPAAEAAHEEIAQRLHLFRRYIDDRLAAGMQRMLGDESLQEIFKRVTHV